MLALPSSIGFFAHFDGIPNHRTPPFARSTHPNPAVNEREAERRTYRETLRPICLSLNNALSSLRMAFHPLFVPHSPCT